MISQERIREMRSQMAPRGNWKEIRRLSKVAEFNGIKAYSETATQMNIQ